MPGEFDHASPLVQRLAYEESTCVDPKYLARVEQALIDAVCEADDRRVEARAGVGKGLEPTVAFNRRFLMQDGRTVTHPGLGNPDIVEPAGPVDPEVGVIGAWDAKDPNRLLGCVVNFACHATTSPGGISANYIHYLEKAIQGYYGKDCVVVFLAGASGDITQVDNRSPYQYPDGERWAQIVGGKVGAEALKVLLTMEPGTLAPVAARSQGLGDPAPALPSPERVKAAWSSSQRDKAEADPTDWTFAKETVLLDALIKKSPTVEVEVQAVQVGPGGLRDDPGRILLPVRPGDQGGQRLPVHVPGVAGQRLRRLRADRGRLRPARRRLRDPADQLQQPRDHRRHPDARRRDRPGPAAQAGARSRSRRAGRRSRASPGRTAMSRRNENRAAATSASTLTCVADDRSRNPWFLSQVSQSLGQALNEGSAGTR